MVANARFVYQLGGANKATRTTATRPGLVTHAPAGGNGGEDFQPMNTNTELYREAEASLLKLQRAMQGLALNDKAAEAACGPIADSIRALMRAEANVARTDYKPSKAI